MSSYSKIRLLHNMAQLYGIQVAYYDVSHRRKQASVETLLATLKVLGAPLASIEDVPSAWREKQQEIWQRPLQPVIIAWEKNLPSIEIRLPYSEADTMMNCRLKLENGEERQWLWFGADGELIAVDDVEGTRYAVKRLLLPHGLPLGYHRLTIDIWGKQEESLVISAPIKAYSPPTKLENRQWGVFMPLYALHTQRSWGAGDFSDLIDLMEWAGDMGGQVIGTLPLLPTFVDRIFEPSPYLPVSRLLWNEFFLDISRVPELRDCPSVRAFLESAPLRDDLEVLRNSALVDYQRQMALKRKALEELSCYFFGEESRRHDGFPQFIEGNPIVEGYARFRAACEKTGAPWQSWPQSLREGVLREGDYDENSRRYHLYVQWLAHQQMADVSEKARGKNLHLYLDLPVGVHPDGYDVWHERDIFIRDASAGAPPDTLFMKGQNWGFPPLHPQKIREQGYRYIIDCLRHHLQYASILRIDHVMGIHRIFCIPHDIEASHGVYLRYNAEELYAILAIESHCSKAVVVGEDLGTVPFYVRPAMKRHGLHTMYVLQYELVPDPQKGLSSPPYNSVASLNTHDMPPFTAFWQGLDIGHRLRLGLLDKPAAEKEKKKLREIKNVLLWFVQSKRWSCQSEKDTLAILKGCLSFLAASPARLLLVNLEDLWKEIKPQNIPSTKTEYPNWQRKSRYSLEQFIKLPEVADILQNVNKLRKQDEDR
jgi:4-alpha-glucanotransferase